MRSIWFDAHLDLALLGLEGRDVSRPPEEAGGPWPPAGLTIPSLREGGVVEVLFTVFTAPGLTMAGGYPVGDVDAAGVAGRRQLDWYDARRDDGSLAGIEYRILMEGADPIRTPDELPEWIARGVVAIGPTWRAGTRYAGGDASGGGLTGIGRDLVAATDATGVVLDLSHLSQRATEDVLAATDRRVVVSHSNVRSLVDGVTERHLADETIAEVGRRGGVIGLNLFRRFLASGEDPRPTVDDAIAHVERICEIQGDRRGVGLGSDLDGGFSAADLCAGIRRPADYVRLADALAARGWTEPEIEGFRRGNWRRVFPADAPGT